MKRKTSSLPTRIMTFGCLPPDVGAAEFSEQLLLAHRYRNKLVEIERARRHKFREIRAQHAPRLVEAERELDQLNGKIEAAFALSKQCATLTRQVDEAKRSRDLLMAGAQCVRTCLVPFAPIEEATRNVQALTALLDGATEARSSLEKLKAERRLVSQEAKAERRWHADLLAPAKAEFRRRVDAHGPVGPHITARLNAEVRAAMLQEPEWHQAWKDAARSEELFLEMVKKARRECRVGSGTYLLVEAAMETARKTASGDVHFVPYTGEGRIGVQLRRTSLAQIRAGESNLLQLAPAPAKPGVAHRPDVYQRVRIRVAADGREPIWAELPVKMHRPIPADAQIKWAWILVRRQGPRLVYSLQLTLETATALVPVRCGSGALIVRLDVRGLTVAECSGNDALFTVECDSKSVELLAFCDSLRAISDRHFDAMRAAVRHWRQDWNLIEPEWLDDALTFMDHWKSHRKLARVAKNWAAEAFDNATLEDLWRHWRTDRLSQHLDLFCSYEELGEWAEAMSLAPEQRFALWLEWWRRKDEHLWAWRANERLHAVRRRRQAYRLVAIALAKHYEMILIDDTPLKTVDAHQRMLVAPSELKKQLMEVFGKDRVRVHATRAAIDLGDRKDTVSSGRG